MNEVLDEQQRETKSADQAEPQRKRVQLFVSIIISLCTIAFFIGITPAQTELPQEQSNTIKPSTAVEAFNNETACTYTYNNMEETKLPQEQSNPMKPGAAAKEPSFNNNDTARTLKVFEIDQWSLLLVNPWYSIPDDFAITLAQLKNGQSVDERIYTDLHAMMEDCRAAGLSPLICSSYRTMQKQTSLFNRKVKKYLALGYSETEAIGQAGKWIAIPGTSEHQLGLAVDIVAESNQRLDKSQEKTAEQQWLMENCHKYGFVLRYPIDKSDITGIKYEPWHYRYVGKEVAAEITERGICLEEYLGVTQQKQRF